MNVVNKSSKNAYFEDVGRHVVVQEEGPVHQEVGDVVDQVTCVVNVINEKI